MSVSDESQSFWSLALLSHIDPLAVPAEQVHDRIMPTGFPSLDRILGGGVRVGELVVLGGAAGSGTSSLALALALKASHSGSIFLTGEMTVDHVAERALAIEARVNVDSLRRGQLSDAEQSRIGATAQLLHDSSPTVETIGSGGVESVIRAVQKRPGTRMIVVDGLESLLSTAESRDDQLAYAVLALKRVAVASRVAVVLVTHLTQLDEQRADRRPRLDDFGARGALAIHADVLLGLYREELYETDAALAGATELLLLKRRDGALGYVDLFFFSQWLRFEDVLEPEG